MDIFDTPIKSVNKLRVLILLLIAISWSINLDEAIRLRTRLPYVSESLGFFAFTVLLGELTRKLFRLVIIDREPRNSRYIIPEFKLQTKSNQEDKETLNFAILWSLLGLFLVM